MDRTLESCIMWCFFVHTIRKFPHTLKEPPWTDDALGIPGRRLIEWSDEHLIESERVGTIRLHNIVRVYDIAVSLAHLATILGHNEPDVLKQRERLVVIDRFHIIEKLVPEACVDEMPRRVLRSPDIHINRRPILLLLLIRQKLLVLGINIPKVVPRRSRPLRHRVCLALGGTFALGAFYIHPFLDIRK